MIFRPRSTLEPRNVLKGSSRRPRACSLSTAHVDRTRGPLPIARDISLFVLVVEAGGLMAYDVNYSYLISARRHLRRQDIEGRQARRSAGPAADQVRVRHQPQDRQGARPHLPADAARPLPTR